MNTLFEETPDAVVTEPTDVARYEQEAQHLLPSDEQSERAALLFISKTREAEKSLDKERKAKTDPLNAEIERITGPYRTAIAAFARLRGLVEGKLNQYRIRIANERQEAQRKAIADANAEKARKEATAKAEREAADLARQNGDELVALKHESKAEKAELAAETVAPVVIEQQAKTAVFDDGSKVTVKTVKDWTYSNGLSKDGDYHMDDQRFKELPAEFWQPDEAKIGRMVRAGAKIPGITVVEKASTMTRKG